MVYGILTKCFSSACFVMISVLVFNSKANSSEFADYFQIFFFYLNPFYSKALHTVIKALTNFLWINIMKNQVFSKRLMTGIFQAKQTSSKEDGRMLRIFFVLFESIFCVAGICIFDAYFYGYGSIHNCIFISMIVLIKEPNTNCYH